MELFIILLQRVGTAIAVILAQLLVAAVLLGVIYMVRILTQFLLGSEDLLLFEYVPLRYLFNAMEAAVIAVVALSTVTESLRILRGRQ